MAKHVEVLLKENVLKLGSMGDIVRVRPGYARNYLLPYGKAIPADAAAKRQVEVLRERAAAAEQEAGGRAEQLKKKVDGLALDIPAKVSHDDHLFGSVGTREIVNALAEKGFELDPRQVHLHENFKRLGRYEVALGLYGDIRAQIAVNVVDADPQGRDMDEVIAEATGEAESQAAAEGE